MLLAEIVSGEQRDWFVTIHEHDSLLENLVEQELTEEEKKAAWEEYENEKKGLRMNGQSFSFFLQLSCDLWSVVVTGGCGGGGGGGLECTGMKFVFLELLSYGV